MNIRSIHYFIVGQLKDSFGCGNLITDYVYVVKLLNFTKSLYKAFTELNEAIERILMEDFRLLHEIHEDSMSLIAEC